MFITAAAATQLSHKAVLEASTALYAALRRFKGPIKMIGLFGYPYQTSHSRWGDLPFNTAQPSATKKALCGCSAPPACAHNSHVSCRGIQNLCAAPKRGQPIKTARSAKRKRYGRYFSPFAIAVRCSSCSRGSPCTASTSSRTRGGSTHSSAKNSAGVMPK